MQTPIFQFSRGQHKFSEILITQSSFVLMSKVPKWQDMEYLATVLITRWQVSPLPQWGL